MRPTKRHLAVVEYVTPEGFAAYQKIAEVRRCKLYDPGLKPPGFKF